MKQELTNSSIDEMDKNELGDTFIEWYSSTLTDYIYKVTIASVLLFIAYPWVAFLWPPYYFMCGRKE